MSSLRGGVSWVASARQRKVSLPVPQSLILAISWSRSTGVSGTFVVPTRRYWQRSITDSGAPCEEELTQERNIKNVIRTCLSIIILVFLTVFPYICIFHWHSICLINHYTMHLICKTCVIRVIINQPICDCIIHSCLDEHLALRARLDRGAVHRHGLAVTRELQGELLLHQLSDHLMDEKDGEKSRNYVSE